MRTYPYFTALIAMAAASPLPVSAYEFAVSAFPTAPSQLLFTGTGGSLVDGALMTASLPVSIGGGYYAGAGLLSISFNYAPSTVRSFYPGPDPYVKGFPVRDGATLVGTLASIDILLTAFDTALQSDVTVLHLRNDNPTTAFGVVKYQEYHSDGRGNVFPAVYGAAQADYAYLQGGYCHLSFCLHNSAANFSLSSDVLDLAGIRPDADSAFAVFLGGIGDSFTSTPDGPFTVGFRGFLYRASVPEPASWALMLTGFGVGGAMLRRQRAVSARGAAPQSIRS